MSALETAERRIMDALARLEAAMLKAPQPMPWDAEREQLTAQVTTLDRDCDLLREECHRLRRELELLQQRYDHLKEAGRAVTDRLAAVESELDDLLGA